MKTSNTTSMILFVWSYITGIVAIVAMCAVFSVDERFAQNTALPLIAGLIAILSGILYALAIFLKPFPNHTEDYRLKYIFFMSSPYKLILLGLVCMFYNRNLYVVVALIAVYLATHLEIRRYRKKIFAEYKQQEEIGKR